MSNDKNKHLDQAESFLFGQMSAEQQAAFKQQRADNADVDAAVRQQQSEHRAMQLLRQQYLREQMTAWQQEDHADTTLTVQPTAKVVSMWSTQRIAQLAAAACMLLVAGYFVFVRSASVDGPKLAMSHYPKMSTTVRGDQASPSAWKQAVDAMDRGQYQQALQLLPQVTAADEYYDAVPLLQGDCQYFMKQYDAALAIFQPLQQTGATEKVRQQAEYRTLLVWLSQNKQDSAEFKALLDKILNTNTHFNFNGAKAIQDGLK
jgi:tetratricopeptide (TPR) repeat protein